MHISPGPDYIITIPNIKFKTNEEGTFYFVINVRGVQTEFTSNQLKFKLQDNVTIIELVYGVIEPFFAFIMACIIIAAGAYQFPVWLLPAPILAIGVFCFLIYT